MELFGLAIGGSDVPLWVLAAIGAVGYVLYRRTAAAAPVLIEDDRIPTLRPISLNEVRPEALILAPRPQVVVAEVEHPTAMEALEALAVVRDRLRLVGAGDAEVKSVEALAAKLVAESLAISTADAAISG